jgi:hypothetical protein
MKLEASVTLREAWETIGNTFFANLQKHEDVPSLNPLVDEVTSFYLRHWWMEGTSQSCLYFSEPRQRRAESSWTKQQLRKTKLKQTSEEAAVIIYGAHLNASLTLARRI